MKRGKKLRKKLRKAEATHPELAEVEQSVKRPIKPLLFALAGLAIVLVAVFLIWPFLHKTPNNPAAYSAPELSYSLKNTSGADWKDVKLSIEGSGGLSSTTLKMEQSVYDQTAKTQVITFDVGNIRAGESKEIKVTARSVIKGSFEYLATFKTADGHNVHAPVTKTLVFQ